MKVSQNSTEAEEQPRFRTIRASNLLAAGDPQIPRWFGPWFFDRERLVLDRRADSPEESDLGVITPYEIDLERCLTPRALLGWLAHMAGKAHWRSQMNYTVKALRTFLPSSLWYSSKSWTSAEYIAWLESDVDPRLGDDRSTHKSTMDAWRSKLICD